MLSSKGTRQTLRRALLYTTGESVKSSLIASLRSRVARESVLGIKEWGGMGLNGIDGFLVRHDLDRKLSTIL